MNSKDKKIICKRIFFIIFAIILLSIIVIYNFTFAKSNSYDTKQTYSLDNVKISNAKEINIDEIITSNTSNSKKEEIEVKEEVLEYITKYKTNTQLPKGTIQVVQEGREGIQQITVKKTYENEQQISEEQIASKVTKASVDKIVEIGGANYTSNYKEKVGDNVYVTSDRLEVKENPSSESLKIATLNNNEELKILEIKEQWYKISSGGTTGWVKKECTTYKNPNEEYEQNTYNQKSKQELIKNLSFNMSLNKPSGLSLEQFKKVLTDSKDTNKVFQNNAQYFYYIEQQYNINGLYIAAIGIHESAWGTSELAKNKNNLFGYGAYDSNPYNGAYTFSNYSESIDLIARVLVKYYINPKGTKIYGDEKAAGTYYNGPTLSGINTKYATDKNWANAVYNHMKYLYEKL